jgi:predicted aspartyl protease
MRKMMKYMPLLSMFLYMCLFPPLEVQGEFYRYTDESGGFHFVDELSKVPLKYRDNMKVYREKNDPAPEDESALILRRELEEPKAEGRKKISGTEYRGNQETSIIIRGNQSLVPVTVGYGGYEIETLLLLDTGASIITLHRDLAVQLNIADAKSAEAMLAGGKMIQTEVVRLDYVKIGALEKEDIHANIIEHEGPPVNYEGFLGMNFLRNFEYSIDFKRGVIRWNP